MKIKLIGLSVLSALLLCISWPISPMTPLILLALTPLLLNEHLISLGQNKSGRKVFLYTYLAFLLWNIGTTWWVWYASEWGSIAAIVCNALLQTLPFWGYHLVKKQMGTKIGLISLIAFWLTFEYIHLNWELTWSWLTLGNSFANYPNYIQWYEYTGALGGTLWIWLVNIIIFSIIISKQKKQVFNVIASFLLILLPVCTSYLIKSDLGNSSNTKVMVVQPNVDSYTEKFQYNARTGEYNKETFIPFNIQMQNLIKLTEQNLTPDIKFVLWPETALPKGYWEHELGTYDLIMELQRFAQRMNVTLLTGADTYTQYTEESKSVTARHNDQYGYYDIFNTAILIDNRGRLNTYHKSKLVPGVEKMPYPQLFAFLEMFAIDLGGTTGSLGEQSERTVLFSSDSIGVAPIICYESIFGEFVGRYFQNRANFIGIITNDGWWGNTVGHKQHFEYARLRAIEHRSWVARAANTGISGFINPNGEITKRLDWDKEGVLIENIGLTVNPTFYSIYGDYIGRIASFLTIGLLLSLFVRKLRK